jgi:hypothetical protein
MSERVVPCRDWRPAAAPQSRPIAIAKSTPLRVDFARRTIDDADANTARLGWENFVLEAAAPPQAKLVFLLAAGFSDLLMLIGDSEVRATHSRGKNAIDELMRTAQTRGLCAWRWPRPRSWPS